MKFKIYELATIVYDWNIPVLRSIADIIRDLTWENKY